MENQESREPPEPPYDFWSRRRWLARLSVSFLLVAVSLIYLVIQNPDFSRGRKILHYIGAMLAFVLFLMGTRERHRPEK